MYFHIYDDKPINVTTDDFKNLIGNSVKQTILTDWNKFVKVNQHKKLNNGRTEYHTIVKICER